MAEPEPVDVEQLAALERVMAERDSMPHWKPHPYQQNLDGFCLACGLAAAAKWHVEPDQSEGMSTHEAIDVPAAQASRAELAAAREASGVLPHPPKPLASFVEAGAVDARLAQMQDELAQVRGMLHHVMVLMMVMGDRQKISKKEYDDAAALIAKAEKAGPA